MISTRVNSRWCVRRWGAHETPLSLPLPLPLTCSLIRAPSPSRADPNPSITRHGRDSVRPSTALSSRTFSSHNKPDTVPRTPRYSAIAAPLALSSSLTDLLPFPSPPRVLYLRDPVTRERLLHPHEARQQAQRAQVAARHMDAYLKRCFSSDLTVDMESGECMDGGHTPDAPTDPDSLPRLGICLSGGGYRAMLSAMGSLTALQQQGLFDSAHYIAGLSGGTWAMSQIYENKRHIQERKKEANKLRQRRDEAGVSTSSSHSSNALFDPLLHSPVDLKRLSENLIDRITSPSRKGGLFSQISLAHLREQIQDLQHTLEEAEQNEHNKKREDETVSSSSTSSSYLSPAMLSYLGLSPSIASSLSLLSTARLSMLSRISLSDLFGWALSHKLLTDVDAEAAHQSDKQVSESEMAKAQIVDAAASVAVSDTSTTAAAQAAMPSSSSATATTQRLPRLSDQRFMLQSCSLPYPLYAAITSQFEQLELTPHSITLPQYDIAAPIEYSAAHWDAGRVIRTRKEVKEEQTTLKKKKKRQSNSSPQQQTLSLIANGSVTSDAAPTLTPVPLPREPSFGFFLACFASAYPARLGRMVEELLHNSSLLDENGSTVSRATTQAVHTFLRALHRAIHASDGRPWAIGHTSPLRPAALPNFMRNLDKDPHYAALLESGKVPNPVPPSLLRSEGLGVMDAGLAFNLPLPPLLHPARHLDVILAFDASAPPEALACDSIRRGRDYARKHNLPFPPIHRSIQPLEKRQPDDSRQSRIPYGLEEESIVRAAAPEPEGDANLTHDEREDESLLRAANAVITIFRGDVAARIPTIIYLPLIASADFKPDAPCGPSHAFHTDSSAQRGSDGRLSGRTGFNQAPLPSSAASPVFDPRADFLRGGFCATLNFSYTPQQATLLTRLSYHNANKAAAVIRQELERIHEEKKKINRGAAPYLKT